MSKKERQANIIQYLNEHQKVATKEILTQLGIAKSTFSEDIKYLKSKGYPIEQEHKYIWLYKTENMNPIVGSEDLSFKIIRKWIILYAVNYYTTCKCPGEITIPYQQIHDICSDIYSAFSFDKNKMSEHTTLMSTDTFRKDLQEMVTDGYLCCLENTEDSLHTSAQNEKKKYVITRKIPRLLFFTKESALPLHILLDEEPYKTIYQNLKTQLQRLFPYNISESSTTKQQHLTSTLDTLSLLTRYPYETNCLNITCRFGDNTDNHILYREFEIGIILYSSETNQFYVFGKGLQEKSKQKQHYLLPTDDIIEIDILSSLNTYYKKHESHDTFSYLLNATLDDNTIHPTEVDFLIIDTQQNRKRVELLKANRLNTCNYYGYDNNNQEDDNTTEITLNPSKVKQYGMIRYTDQILGKSDLLQLINSFYDEIQILSPANIMSNITQDNQKWKDRYEEAFQSEYKENIHDCL